MNMKKILGVLLAGIIGICSSTALVSAEENSITYNLVNTTYKTNPGSVCYRTTLSADFSKVTNGVIQLFLNIPEAVDPASAKWTVTCFDGERNKLFLLKDYTDGEKGGVNSSKWVSTEKGLGSLLEIPLNETGININNIPRLFMEITVVCEHTDTTNTYKNLNGTIGYNFNSTMDVDTNNDGEYDKYSNNVYTKVEGWNITATQLETVESEYTIATTVVDKRFPLMTTINPYTDTGSTYISNGKNDVYLYIGTKNVSGNYSNILSYLGANEYSLVDKDKSYINAVPVINDILANYNNVTFTFNTATENILYEENVGYYYNEKGKDTYKKFDQHLYNLYGDETTNYIYSNSYDWSDYNLFTGAIIVNGNLSMSLNDINVFNYGKNSLSFNWEDIVNGEVVNNYAYYLNKLQLATSTTWFWDSLTITYSNEEVEDVGSEAGVAAEEDIIEDEIVEESIVETETPIVEDIPVVEENPATGNTPIAMSIIPVALAAVAMIIKKQK